MIVGAGQTDFHLDDQPIGNGRALALLLAREGAHVIAVDRNESSANGTVQLIRSEGGRADTLVADVVEPQSIERMIGAAQRQLGGIDGLVYNVVSPDPWDLRRTRLRRGTSR